MNVQVPFGCKVYPLKQTEHSVLEVLQWKQLATDESQPNGTHDVLLAK